MCAKCVNILNDKTDMINSLTVRQKKKKIEKGQSHYMEGWTAVRETYFAVRVNYRHY